MKIDTGYSSNNSNISSDLGDIRLLHSSLEMTADAALSFLSLSLHNHYPAAGGEMVGIRYKFMDGSMSASRQHIGFSVLELFLVFLKKLYNRCSLLN